MIQKISDPAEALIRYEECSTEHYPETGAEWKRHLEPILPLMQGRRNFIIISPQFKTKEGNFLPALTQGFITMPPVEDALAEEILERWCEEIGNSNPLLFYPYVFNIALAYAPYRLITILETNPRTWLEIIHMRGMAGQNSLVSDLTIKDMPDGGYAGVTNEIVYNHARKTFKQTRNKYLKSFEDAWINIQNSRKNTSNTQP